MIAARPENDQCVGGNDGRSPSATISPAKAGAFLAAARVVAAGVRSPRSSDAVTQNHVEKRTIANGLGVESNSQSSTQLLGSRKHRVSAAWASSELSAGLAAYAGEPAPSRSPRRSWAGGLSPVKMPQRAPSSCRDLVGVPAVGSRSAAGSDVGVEHGWSRKPSRSPSRCNVTDGVGGGDFMSRSIGSRPSPGVDAGTEVGSTVGRAKSPTRFRNSGGETARWADVAAEAVTSAALDSYSKVPVAGRSLPGALPRWDVSPENARSPSPRSPREGTDAVGGGRHRSPSRQREEINPPYATTDSQGRQALMPRQQLREVQAFRDGYDVGFKSIRTFKDSRHYKSCSALNPQSGGHTWDAGLEPHSPFVKEGGDQLRTRKNFKEATESTNLARTLRFEGFENTSGSGGERVDLAPPHRPCRRFLRPTSEQQEPKDDSRPESKASACASGDLPQTTSQKIPETRSDPPLETSRRRTASRSGARSSSPNERMRAAGRQTPRHDCATGMVFRGSDEADFRNHTNLGSRRILANTSPVGSGALSPRSNIVTEGALGGSSPEKENGSCERFLGDRRCRSMRGSPWASPGSTPWVSPTPSPAATPHWSPRGNLQWQTMVDQRDNHVTCAVQSPRGGDTPPPPGPEARRDAILFQRKNSQPFSPASKDEEARFRKREMSQQEYSTKTKSVKPVWRR
eukprot:TRINITY_DN77115_c0_g1_i1.p1 TRINITY_DN77115_c0_g1~~TRINITY_DN77115_c0_g1_i1.p1  ORF type:complete len:686 (-),score=87.49 TRINITY_DN77115_c0_g1_i1:141-2198(-)